MRSGVPRASVPLGSAEISGADPDLALKTIFSLSRRHLMPSFTCPNDGAPMESDVDGARSDVSHTCPECGYSETR